MLRIRKLLPVLLASSATFLSAQRTSVHPGTEIPVELRTKIDTHSVKPGAKLEFRTTEAVLIGHSIVVPENATVIGHVEQVRDGGSASPNSLLRITIGTLKWKHGEAPLNAVIISIERTPAQEMLMARGRHFNDPPTFLNDVHIRSNISREASIEFYSKRRTFLLTKGLCFLLRQIDPDHDSTAAGKDHTLDVGPQD